MTDKQEKIHIIATGGTIDSKFYPPTESSQVKDKTGIADFLDQIIQPHFSYTLNQLCMLDSGNITDEIRKEIIGIIEETTSSKILITHGTNTMVETLNFLEENLKHNEKTILITGSMIPMDGFCPTDGGFNLGYAISKLQAMNAGLYIAMNGDIFSPEKVKKNFEIGRFEHTQES